MKTKSILLGIIVMGLFFIQILTNANQTYGPSMNGRGNGYQGFDPAVFEKYQEDEAAKKAEAERVAQLAWLEKYRNDFVPKDPWRAHDGETNYIKADGVEFCGKVLQVQDGGIRISGNYGPIFTANYYANVEDADNNREFFVANFPFQAAEDEFVSEDMHYMAYYVGTYTYTTVQGASRTIRKLDYGVPCDVPQWFLDQQKELQEAAQAAALAQQKKLFIVQSNTVVWLQSQATNGSPSAQCSLAEHYLNGVGTETNRDLAIHWLLLAANSGDTEASSVLLRITKTNSIASQ